MLVALKQNDTHSLREPLHPRMMMGNYRDRKQVIVSFEEKHE